MAGSQPVWVLSADLFAEVINVFTIPHTVSAMLDPPCQTAMPLGCSSFAREILQSPQSRVKFIEHFQIFQFL